MKQDACFDLRMIGADAVPTIALASELFIERNGKGTFTFADGSKYIGQFKDGKMHGQGTLTYADGRKYVGRYKGDTCHGRGKFTFADGEVYHDGEWENDEPKK